MCDEPTSRGSFLRLNYLFESRKDRVEVSEIQKFNEAIEKAKDSLGYTLTYSPARTKHLLVGSDAECSTWPAATDIM